MKERLGNREWGLEQQILRFHPTDEDLSVGTPASADPTSWGPKCAGSQDDTGGGVDDRWTRDEWAWFFPTLANGG